MIKSFFDSQNIIYGEDTSLRNYNTYRLDTKCKYLIFPKNITELIAVLKELTKNSIKYIILGNGSNIILSMKYYDGVVIRLDYLNNVSYDGTTVTAEAGCSLIKLALETIEKGLSGLEFAAGIPGCVGASTAMNAGAYNSDMSKIVKEVKVLTPDFRVINLTNDDLKYEYRDSFIKKNKNYIVLSTTMELSYGNTEEMKELVAERRKKRQLSQPLNMPSAGSVFRNPENMYAGELIEKCHLLS